MDNPIIFDLLVPIWVKKWRFNPRSLNALTKTSIFCPSGPIFARKRGDFSPKLGPAHLLEALLAQCVVPAPHELPGEFILAEDPDAFPSLAAPQRLQHLLKVGFVALVLGGKKGQKWGSWGSGPPRIGVG